VGASGAGRDWPGRSTLAALGRGAGLGLGGGDSSRPAWRPRPRRRLCGACRRRWGKTASRPTPAPTAPEALGQTNDRKPTSDTRTMIHRRPRRCSNSVLSPSWASRSKWPPDADAPRGRPRSLTVLRPGASAPLSPSTRTEHFPLHRSSPPRHAVLAVQGTTLFNCLIFGDHYTPQ
jgi:hypothetical protein